MAYRVNTKHRPIKLSYYNRAIDGWFMALEEHNGDPKQIIKQDILEKSGLTNQWFTHNFGTLDDFYSVIGDVVTIKLKKAIIDYNEWIIKKRDIWEQATLTAYVCSKECRIALIRGDFSFWMNVLSSLKPVLTTRVTKGGEDEEAFLYAYAVFVCLFSMIISDWNEKGFDKNYRKVMADRVAGISKSLSYFYPYLKSVFQKS